MNTYNLRGKALQSNVSLGDGFLCCSIQEPDIIANFDFNWNCEWEIDYRFLEQKQIAFVNCHHNEKIRFYIPGIGEFDVKNNEHPVIITIHMKPFERLNEVIINILLFIYSGCFEKKLDLQRLQFGIKEILENAIVE